MRWVAILLVLVLLLPGCVDPFQVQVPPQLIEDSERSWEVRRDDVAKVSFVGPRVQVTEYRHESTGQGPSGFLLLTAIRSINRLSEDELLDRTQDVLEEQLREQGVVVDEVGQRDGTRTWANGLQTTWTFFVGSVPDDSPIFAQDQEIRILAEATYDEESRTHVVVIALAGTTRAGVLGPQTDLRTWREMVGDPQGSIDDQVNAAGFIDRLVTR